MLTLMMGSVVSYAVFVDGKQTRWYSEKQVTMGKALFTNHCAQCHGLQAQGLVANWQGRLADGSYPPPPLNGTAHAWHHDLPVLIQIVQEGGAPYDGKMPGFAGMLNKQQQLAVVAYFQSFWNDDVYRMWQGEPSDKPFTTASTFQDKRLDKAGVSTHAAN